MGVGGSVEVENITNHLAASSLGSKIHVGTKTPCSSCRNVKTRMAASAKSTLLLPGRPLQNQLDPTYAHAAGGGGWCCGVMWVMEGGSTMNPVKEENLQSHIQNENMVAGGGGGTAHTSLLTPPSHDHSNYPPHDLIQQKRYKCE